MSWTRACGTGEIAPGEAIQIGTEPVLAIYHINGEYFATEDTCTHDDASLSEGYIDGSEVECAWHFAKFCIKSGKVLSPPAMRPLKTYAVRVIDDEVQVDLP